MRAFRPARLALYAANARLWVAKSAAVDTSATRAVVRGRSGSWRRGLGLIDLHILVLFVDLDCHSILIVVSESAVLRCLRLDRWIFTIVLEISEPRMIDEVPRIRPENLFPPRLCRVDYEPLCGDDALGDGHAWLEHAANALLYGY